MLDKAWLVEGTEFRESVQFSELAIGNVDFLPLQQNNFDCGVFVMKFIKAAVCLNKVTQVLPLLKFDSNKKN